MTNNISVIICTYNECRNVKKCIVSVLKSDERINDIIVIDDCSTDKTIERVRELNDSRVRAYCKDHTKLSRGKNDSIYYGAQLARNENILIVDCDTISVDNSDAINRLLNGADLVGTIIEVIPGDTTLSKLEKIEYDIAIKRARPWLYKNLNYLNNVSGAGFAIKRKHLIENRIPTYVKGEDMALTQLGIKKGWKIDISNSVIKTYATPGLKALFIQRNRWVSGYYSVMKYTGRYVPLIESLIVYYRTAVLSAFVLAGTSVTGHFLILSAITMFLYFLNEYRFIKNVKWTLLMMVYRQINFISALTFWKYGRTWTVLR